jgi:hypothetical protein
MLALGQNNIYDFRLQTLAQVQQMLGQLLVEKQRFLDLNIPVIAKMFDSIEALSKTATDTTLSKSIQAFNESAITFLDKDLLEIFYNDPTDQEMRDALSIELVLVSAATGNITGLTPYTDEEMLEILKNKEIPYYNDALFVYTLRKSFENNTSNALFSAMVKILPGSAKVADNVRMYYWDEIFVQTMMLHSIWRHFLYLSPNDQQFLLQNYFYQSIIVGVPVKVAVQEAGKFAVSRREGEKMGRFLMEMLLEGKESIPLKTLMREGKLTGLVFKDFIQKSATEKINTLVLEKFVSDMYRGQEDAEYFALWLRETLSLVWNIRTADILKINYGR